MYETFEHTADLGLRITAPDLPSLFEQAGEALFATIVEDLETVRPVQKLTVELTGDNKEDLLYDWLQTLLVHFDADHLLFRTFTVTLTEKGLTATCEGEPLDLARHPLAHEVKAITYHGLRLEPLESLRPPDSLDSLESSKVSTGGGSGWRAEVIIDI